MTVAELREVLHTLPRKYDNTEICIEAPGRLAHVAVLDLDRRAIATNRFPHLKPDRLTVKLKLKAGNIWWEYPDVWRLEGPWPEELAELGGVEELA